jgi:hypothetical protein
MDDIRGRAALRLVPDVAQESVETLTFCGHCGTRPGWAEISEAPSRVCESCGLGLLLEAATNAAPHAGDAFMVLDSSLSVCALSSGAEELLATREIDAVHRHITELLLPADAEAQARENLAVAVSWAARGEQSGRMVTVRPANTFGVRLRARISSCGPPQAALVVFD